MACTASCFRPSLRSMVARAAHVWPSSVFSTLASAHAALAAVVLPSDWAAWAAPFQAATHVGHSATAAAQTSMAHCALASSSRNDCPRRKWARNSSQGSIPGAPECSLEAAPSPSPNAAPVPRLLVDVAAPVPRRIADLGAASGSRPSGLYLLPCVPAAATSSTTFWYAVRASRRRSSYLPLPLPSDSCALPSSALRPAAIHIRSPISTRGRTCKQPALSVELSSSSSAAPRPASPSIGCCAELLLVWASAMRLAVHSARRADLKSSSPSLS
mmetsp:Transcript_14599/g.39496  ORF Transcript_14599/g.39496 Transcript_14599/m.39496 type:complete len:272 (-) Transcript_14599:436-1251(-)